MPTVDQTTGYFDRRSRALRRSALIDKWSALAPLLDGLPADSLVMECGAGTGLYTIPLLRSGFRVVSIDLSAASLDELQLAVEREGMRERVQCVVGDFRQAASSLPEAADAVTFIKVLHHFPDRDAIRQAVWEAWKIVRTGGRIVMFEPNGRYPL